MKTVNSRPIEFVERERGSRCCDDIAPRISAEQAQSISSDIQALAHPIRLQILDMLSRKEGMVCVCDLEAALPVKQPTVSHHLKLLREAGLIDFERRGLWAYYFVKGDALASLRERLSDAISALTP